MAWGLNAKYALEKATFFAGYERIHFGNASDPLPVGFNIGGYTAAVVNNVSVQGERLEVVWAGARYWATSRIEAVFGWDRYRQNNFHGDGCRDASFNSCSGTEDVYALFADYHVSKKFELYAGAMYSRIAGGLANGYFHDSNIDPTAGLRVSW
jgi:predicted porin